MVEPLSITTACLSITAAVPTLMMRILAFVSEVKGARKDLDGVHRELSSLQLCLNALRIEDTTGRSKLPPDVVTQTCQILVNIETTMRQISNLLDKLGSGRLGRRIQWAAAEKDEMSKLRSSLESNKTALEISLTLGTINMLVEQNAQTQTQQDQTVQLTTMTQILTLQTATTDGKVDALLQRKDNTQNIANIQAALAELKEELVALATSGVKQPSVEKFTQIATDLTVSSISSSEIGTSDQITQVVREIQTVSSIHHDPEESNGEKVLCPRCTELEQTIKHWKRSTKDLEEDHFQLRVRCDDQERQKHEFHQLIRYQAKKFDEYKMSHAKTLSEIQARHEKELEKSEKHREDIETNMYEQLRDAHRREYSHRAALEEAKVSHGQAISDMEADHEVVVDRLKGMIRKQEEQFDIELAELKDKQQRDREHDLRLVVENHKSEIANREAILKKAFRETRARDRERLQKYLLEFDGEAEVPLSPSTAPQDPPLPAPANSSKPRGISSYITQF